MAKASEVVVLAEDEPQKRFIYRYLKELGYSLHEVRFDLRPSGRGSGEQWVRERYGEAVQAYRWRSKKLKTRLIVIIDADTGDVQRRLRQLHDALAQHGLSQRDDHEAIVHLVPKRNIETWILNLVGRDVNEEADYSRERGVDEHIPSAAAAFYAGTRPNATPPPNWVPSLRAAIPEARRLD